MSVVASIGFSKMRNQSLQPPFVQIALGGVPIAARSGRLNRQNDSLDPIGKRDGVGKSPTPSRVANHRFLLLRSRFVGYSAFHGVPVDTPSGSLIFRPPPCHIS